jgi:hypothetical protein
MRRYVVLPAPLDSTGPVHFENRYVRHDRQGKVVLRLRGYRTIPRCVDCGVNARQKDDLCNYCADRPIAGYEGPGPDPLTDNRIYP